MKKIFKYPIGGAELEWITIPQGSELLTVKMQNGFPFLWALIDDAEAIHVLCEILTIETGAEIEDRWKVSMYLGTVLILDDTKVFHFFGLIGNGVEIEPPPAEFARWTE